MENTTPFELLRTRRSIRRFTEQQPSRALIERIVEAACWAPSNHNRQGWKFVVLEDREELRRLASDVEASLSQRVKKSRKIPPAQVEEMIQNGELQITTGPDATAVPISELKEEVDEAVQAQPDVEVEAEVEVNPLED